MKQVRMARNGYVLLSVIFYIMGIIYMVIPFISPMALCMIGGLILIIYGIVKIMGYFSDDRYCLAFQYDLACGLLLIALGVIVLACNMRVYQHLSSGLGLLILLDALLKIQMSKDAQRFGLETWKRILICNIIAGVLGILIIVKPFSAAGICRIISGCGLLAEGFMNHLMVRETVNIMNANALPDKKDKDTD
ncbi:MAG: DUF308 domain-containing protein [Lachnospiraceae bacterium]